MSNHKEHFQTFLTYAFMPLLLIGMIGVIVMLFMLAYDAAKDLFPRFPQYTAKADTTIPRTYIRPVHIDNIETSQEQGWELLDNATKLPGHPDYVIMTKPAED